MHRQSYLGEFADLQKMRADNQIEAHADDADHGADSPNKIVHGIVDESIVFSI